MNLTNHGQEKLWSHQIEAVETVQNACKDRVRLVSLLMSVGSGKTNCAFELFAEFIKEHENEKTFQTFVCPRLKLCKQQAIDLVKYLWSCNIDFEVYMYNSYGRSIVVKDENNKHEDYKIEKYYNQGEFPDSNHVIFITCAPSMWKDSECVNIFKGHLVKNEKEGRLNGFIVYDEAHNYGSQEDEKSKTFFTYGNNKDEVDGFAKFFQTSIFMSGTPSDYMKEMTVSYSYSCHQAVMDNRILRPTLYLIVDPHLYKGNFSVDEDFENVSEKHYASAILKMVNKELEDAKDEYGVRSLICIPPKGVETSGRNTIKNILETLKDEDINIISLISKGPSFNKKGDEIELQCAYKLATDKEITEKDFDEHTAMTMIENIDKIDTDPEESDLKGIKLVSEMLENKRPIVVFQIDKISEGVNICSFNSVMITSKKAVKQLQQSARAFRKYPGKTHASVYCLTDTVNRLGELVANLFDNGFKPGDVDWGFVNYVGGSGSETGPAKFNEWTAIKDDELVVAEVMPNGKTCFETTCNLSRKSDELYEVLSKLPKKDLEDFKQAKVSKKDRKKNNELSKKANQFAKKVKNDKTSKESENELDKQYVLGIINFVANILAGTDIESEMNRELWRQGLENLVLNRKINNEDISKRIIQIIEEVLK